MTNVLMKIVIIIYGPPGAGKGTQARLLANKLDLIHFDSGRYLRELFYDSKNKKNKIIQKERKLNEAGKLCTPSWVLKVISKKVREIKGLLCKGVVLSGSPRTMFETFGDGKNKGLIKTLEETYGKKNIYILKINISEKETVERNTRRLVCSICGLSILGMYIDTWNVKICPFCGGKLKHRFDDIEKVIVNRIKEYRERTEPIVEELKKRKYKVFEISGGSMPYEIHEKIMRVVSRK